MILQALCGYYRRALHENIAVPYGFAMQSASLVIVIDRGGDVKGTYTIEERAGKKFVPALLCVPISPKRSGSRPKPAFLCENLAFLFGLYDDPEAARYRFDASADIHKQVLSGVEDDGARALLRFFDKRVQGCVPGAKDDAPLFKDARKVAVFRLEGDTAYLHDRPAIAAAWSEYVARGDRDAPLAQCLVTGETTPIARLHGNVAGFGQDKPTLVGFNQDAFTSYGKIQGENAPVGVQAAFEYVTALNLLIRDDRHHTNIAGDKLVYWAERAAQTEEDLTCVIMDGAPEKADSPLDAAQRDRIRGILNAILNGGSLAEHQLDPNVRFFILGLSANKTRLIVRFFLRNSFGELLGNAIRHYRDIGITGMRSPFPAPRELLLEAAPMRKLEDVPASLETALMRSILQGAPYPTALYMAVITRICHEAAAGGQLVSPLRAGLLKGYLIRETKEEIGMALDQNERDPAYLLGRLFALLEIAQDSAIENLNASIADKYLNTAIASPQSVFPTLMCLNKKHLSKLMKLSDKAGLSVYIGKQISGIMALLSLQESPDGKFVFPISMNANEQGKFLVGYYHQTQFHYSKKEEDA